MATYTPSTIRSFLQPGVKRIELDYQQGQPLADLTGKKVNLVGKIFSVIAQSTDAATGWNCLLVNVADDLAAPGVNQVLKDLPAGTLVNINGQWAFTASDNPNGAVPIVSVGMVAAGVVAALGNLSFIFVNVHQVDEVTQPGAGVLSALVESPMESLVVVGFFALIAFIAWKVL